MEGALATRSPAAAWLDRLLERAVADGVADVHLEPDAGGLWVRLRSAQGWDEQRVPPGISPTEVGARIKVLARLDPNERRLPLDGRLSWRHGDRVADFRVATLPSLYGEVVALRVLQRSVAPPPLGDLGLSAVAEARLRTWLAQQRGLVVIAGPTGAGKTTTAYATLGCLDASTSKIMTVEDPVEFRRDGLVQIAVDPDHGLTFAGALRAVLRQDPDVIFVGEVRDAATAAVAVQAALTGHGVVATLHAASVEGAVIRLLDLGVEPFLLADALAGVVAQRLIPRLCPACRVVERWPREFQEAEPDEAGEEMAVSRLRPSGRGAGCTHCSGRGMVGRLGIFEVVEISARIRTALLCPDAVAELRSAIAGEGGGTLCAQVRKAARRGEVAVAEALRWTHDEGAGSLT
jgi:type II secretory ATPase GspE/PulE/Tfp pilus assembly ATPase PilB-like protein